MCSRGPRREGLRCGRACSQRWNSPPATSPWRLHPPLRWRCLPPELADVSQFPTLVAELEARAIQAALAATGGNKVAAARRLGIARATLYEKLAQPPSDH